MLELQQFTVLCVKCPRWDSNPRLPRSFDLVDAEMVGIKPFWRLYDFLGHVGSGRFVVILLSQTDAATLLTTLL